MAESTYGDLVCSARALESDAESARGKADAVGGDRDYILEVVTYQAAASYRIAAELSALRKQVVKAVDELAGIAEALRIGLG